MRLARSLLSLSAVVFAVTAIGYLVVPGVMLSVVGLTSTDTSDFLIRTEGVALLAGAIFLWAARSGSSGLLRIVLVGLGIYYVLGSLVDLAAFAQGLVGAASVPSAAVRILLGVLCFVGVVRITDDGRDEGVPPSDGPAGSPPPEAPEIDGTAAAS
jgi:hypothetical protein